MDQILSYFEELSLFMIFLVIVSGKFAEVIPELLTE